MCLQEWGHRMERLDPRHTANRPTPASQLEAGQIIGGLVQGLMPLRTDYHAALTTASASITPGGSSRMVWVSLSYSIQRSLCIGLRTSLR